MSREPFEWVEIDQDYCSRTYGSSPCTASVATGGQKCFNTRISCQDPANYDLGTPLTLRFCKSMSFLPRDAYYIPSLVSASVSPARLNPGGVNRSSGALGVRSQITVNFQDHAHTDRYVDPYVADRTYIPVNQSTFWAKWRARNPYYLNRPLRYYTGFIENGVIDPATIIVRSYFITAFNGPDASGNVSITGQDALALLQNEKAQAPAASSGKLSADIGSSASHCTLTPTGIGDAEYPSAGWIRIGSEVIEFTRTGDTMTHINRGEFGTTADAHKAGDNVQLCLVYQGETPADILEDLCLNYGRIGAGYLDTAQWATEQTDFMPRLYSAVITAPTGVEALISEMTEEMYFYPYWDERVSKVKIRAVRPAEGDTVYQLNENSNLVESSVSIGDKTDQLITQVWVYYGIKDPTKSLTDPTNFSATEVIGDLSAEADEKNRQSRIKTVFCRWITSTNGAAAIDLGEKLLARYSAVPREVQFSLGAKDSVIWLGDFVQISSRHNVDMYGNQRPLNIQVFSAQESIVGTVQTYSGQEFVFEKPADPNDRLIVISANQTNVNLRTLHDELYSAPVGGETVRVVVRTGVIIGGRTAADLEGYTGTQGVYPSIYSLGGSVQTVQFNPWANRDATARTLRAYNTAYDGATMVTDMWEVPCSVAIETGSWPVGVTLILDVESGGMIVGEGGYVTSHVTASSSLFRIFASDGGHAIKATYPISINNLGIIGGGGAGGMMFSAAWGGGGAGYAPSISLTQSEDALNPGSFGFTPTIYRSAEVGSALYPGAGSIVRLFAGGGYVDNTGYPGGGLGISTRLPGDTTNRGGRAGNAVIAGSNLITWVNKGDVRGAEAV